MMVLAIAPRQMQMLQLMLYQEKEDDEAALALLLYQRRRRRRRRKYWMRPWITRRPIFGDYDNLMAELERESHRDFT